MPEVRSLKRAKQARLNCPLNIIGACEFGDGLASRRTEMFGSDMVLLAEGPMAGRATLLRGARGVLLSRVEDEAADADWFHISVVFTDGRSPIEIEWVKDDAALIARWRRLGLDLGLPLLILEEGGMIVETNA